MIIDRRRLLGGLSASVLIPRAAQAAMVTDAAGRAITIPEKVERIFPAGPPAAILLYTLAPEEDRPGKSADDRQAKVSTIDTLTQREIINQVDEDFFVLIAQRNDPALDALRVVPRRH